jgi:hypothetical protein
MIGSSPADRRLVREVAEKLGYDAASGLNGAVLISAYAGNDGSHWGFLVATDDEGRDLPVLTLEQLGPHVAKILRVLWDLKER